MVNNIRRKKRSLYNQPKIFSPRKEKEAKKKVNFSPFLKLFLVIVITAVALYFVFLSNLFKVTDVLVEGNQLVSKDKIIQSVPMNKNIFLTSSDEIRQNLLEKVPELKDVQVYKGVPNAIKVVVLEHNQAIVWKSSDRYYLVSSEGYVYRDVTDNITEYQSLLRVEDNSNIKIDHTQRVVSPSFVSFVQNIQNNLFQTINIEPDYYYITESTFDLNLKTKAGFVIKFDTLRSSKKQLDDLKKVIDQKRDQISEYVDLRIDGWAYFK